MKKIKNIKMFFGMLLILLCLNACATGAIMGNPDPTPTNTLPPPLPTLPLLTLTPTITFTPTDAPPTETPTPEPTPTIHGVNNPSGIISAGMPVIFDGFVMVVDKSGMNVDGDFIGFSIQISSFNEESRLFRYNAASIKLMDDLGNQYDYQYNIGFGSRCTESDIFKPKQFLLEPEKEVIVEPHTSMMYSSYFWWCLDSHDFDIPGFQAVIPTDAKSLFLDFDGFGSFPKFSYEFEL